MIVFDTVLFFTAGQLPTPTEQAAIDELEATPGVQVKVRSALAANYTGGIPEQGDYIAGAPGIRPAVYADTVAYPEYEPPAEVG